MPTKGKFCVSNFTNIKNEKIRDMKIKKLIHLLAFLLIFSVVSAEQFDSISQFIDLESVSIQAVRANERAPVSFSTMERTELQRLNNASNIPVLLQLMPSIVATTENGTAMGNTSFRIRGVDASRINVTLNGLPLNNPASQEVFWVNLPNLAGFLNSVQVQRGIGTSTNGSSAFGASINLETDKISAKSGLDFSVLAGSFNTFGVNVSVNSGLLKNGFFVEGKLTTLHSDGYIRNGKIDHQSAYLSAGLVKNKHFLKFNYLYGDQLTGITWEGASLEDIKKNRRHNPAGYMFTDENGNPVYYDNETDNYFSHILQAFYVFDISEHWKFNAGFNYTKGFGYYENYRINQRFSRLNLPNLDIDGIIYDRSDIVRQKLMSNNFYATNANFLYSKNNLNVNIGGHFSHYDGEHYGNLEWIKVYEEHHLTIPNNHEWYRNKSKKSEASIFTKFDYTFLQNFNAFLDLQYRFVRHSIKGTDDDNNLTEMNFSEDYSFFNPKIGLSYQPDIHQKWYVSVSKASREPTRADIKDRLRITFDTIKSEHLINYELGYQINKNRWAFGSNIYFMNYKNQLVPNGRLTESGYTLMDNIDKSYRLGLELIGGFEIFKPLRIDANLTLSQNKIREYIVRRPIYLPGTTTFVRYDEYTVKSSDLAFSPNVVGAGILTYSPIKNLDIMLTGKYVGEQFYDNLSTKENVLDAYFVSDLSVRYEFQVKKKSTYNFYVQAMVNNLFNKDYISNAWVSTRYFTNETSETYKGFFVQAPIHFSIKFGVKL
jgi:iron complex outermembrane receptor protein